MHCKTRKVRVTEAFETGRYGVASERPGTITISMTGEDGTMITINTKAKNIGKFPAVGSEVTADLYLRPIQAD